MTAPVRPADVWAQGADRSAAGKPDPADNGAAVIDLLDKPVYSMGQTDRLLRVSDGTSRRWIDGYESRGKVYEPLIREARTGSDMVTWGEYVEARLISEYRQQGVTVFRLRPAIMELRERLGKKHPLAYSSPFTSVEGRELVLEVQASTGLQPSLYLVLRSGQLLIPSMEVEGFRKTAEYDEELGFVRRINITGTIAVDPNYASGQPTVAGRRLRVGSIVEAVEAGESREDIRETWDIDDGVIDDAVRCMKIA